MSRYCFRTVTLEGKLVAETSSVAGDIDEAIACGLRIASDIKDRHPPGTGCCTWFVDIVDPLGQVLLSVPLAMASRRAKAEIVAR